MRCPSYLRVAYCMKPTQLLLPALFAAATLCGAEPIDDYRFKVEKLAEGMHRPMELEIAPDGRIFFNEYETGKLRYLNPVTKAIVDVGVLKTFTDQENGFLGFALDPKFAENGWIYC